MTEALRLTIPVELTAAMVMRAGVITNEKRARELAEELHEIVAACVELFRADKRRFVRLPDDPEQEPTVLEDLRGPNALEIADFTLAAWRQALVLGDGNTPDGAEAEWISVLLAGLCDEDLYLRWLMIGDIVTSRDVADLLMDGSVQ
jgi:hypothetical protein